MCNLVVGVGQGKRMSHAERKRNSAKRSTKIYLRGFAILPKNDYSQACL